MDVAKPRHTAPHRPCLSNLGKVRPRVRVGLQRGRMEGRPEYTGRPFSVAALELLLRMMRRWTGLLIGRWRRLRALSRGSSDARFERAEIGERPVHLGSKLGRRRQLLRQHGQAIFGRARDFAEVGLLVGRSWAAAHGTRRRAGRTNAANRSPQILIPVRRRSPRSRGRRGHVQDCAEQRLCSVRAESGRDLRDPKKSIDPHDPRETLGFRSRLGGAQIAAELVEVGERSAGAELIAELTGRSSARRGRTPGRCAIR